MPDFWSNASARSVPNGRFVITQSLRNTRPSVTAGPAKPARTGVRHKTFRPSAGNFSTMLVSFQTGRRILAQGKTA